MVFERILGNVATVPKPPPTQEQDVVELFWHECPRRAMRKRSRLGREIAFLMPPGAVLRDRDILVDDSQVRLIIEILPSEVLIAKPRSALELGRLAFELGNLHVPAELTGNEIRVSPDGPVIEIIERLGIPFELRTCIFQPVFAAGGVTLSPNLKIVRRAVDRAEVD